MKKDRVLYYNDELNDDFVKAKTNLDVTIDENYEYLINGYLRKFLSFLIYHFIAFPLLFLEGKIFRGIKVVGKKNLKSVKKNGYIMYCNHTDYKDAYLGHVFISHPKRTYIIANKDAVSIYFIRRLVKDLGALPVPETLQAYKNFNQAISKVLKDKKCIMIYPEAHIWPYYTKIRPFPVTSFRYCASNNVPCVPVAMTYQKRKGLFMKYKKPRQVVYIGKPMFPSQDLSIKDNANNLRNYTYDFMDKTTSEHSTYEYIKYVKKEPETKID